MFCDSVGNFLNADSTSTESLPKYKYLCFLIQSLRLKNLLGNGCIENRQSLCISHCFLNVQMEKLREIVFVLVFFYGLLAG